MSRRTQIRRLLQALTGPELRRVLANHAWVCPRCIELRSVVGPVEDCVVAEELTEAYQDLLLDEELCSCCGAADISVVGLLVLCRVCRDRHLDELGARGLVTAAMILAEQDGGR